MQVEQNKRQLQSVCIPTLGAKTKTRRGWGTRPLWYPTHFAKNAKWMGHGAFVDSHPGAKTKTRRGWGTRPLWYPTHFAKNAKWMGHGAFVDSHLRRKDKDAPRVGHPKFHPLWVGEAGGRLK
jgi:ribosomal protein S6